MKVYIEPMFRGPDEGDGGIRRVVEAQHRWLPRYDIEIVSDIQKADLVASHAGNIPEVPTDKPWVVHTHGLYWSEYEWPHWAQELNRRVIEAMRRCDHVTAPSEWVANALRRGMWLRPTVLLHGIEPEQWDGGTNGGYVLWNKTRVDPICDPRPMNELAARLPAMRFISTFGAEMPNAEITGKLPFEEAKDLIRNAGVYLCTTRETMGVGTLEAMAAGVPILGWRWGGQAEFIRHKETGWLATPGDFDGLLEGLHWCIEHRNEMGQAARAEAMERFTWERVMKSYADLYEAMVGKFALPRPKVSVVTCCYKLAKYLPDAVRSIQAQTMKDWEIVIVDDASPDNTPEVAKMLAKGDNRVRYIRNEKNLYLAGALNAGIAASKGKYIIPLDADNMLEPRTLEYLSGALDGDRSIHVAYGSCRFVLEDGQSPDTSVSVDGVSRWPMDFSFRDQILHRNQCPSTSMFRREVWERVGGYRLRCPTAEDADFWTRISSYGFVPKKVTGAVTLIYRNRDESMSHVVADWGWNEWLPWSRHIALTPFGAAVDPPKNMGLSWPVPSCEPVKISVIIPVGIGHEEIVIDALDSVEAQTFRQWEAIVINDTGKPLKLPHPWAVVIDTPGGIGAARARNIGIELSKGALFVPLDADDYLQPDALERMLSAWLNTGDIIYSQWWDDHAEDGSKVYDPPEYDANLLLSNGCIHAVTALYPKSVWREVGGFDPTMPNWEDWDFQLKLAKVGMCSTKIPKPLFTYRKRHGFRREENHVEFKRGQAAMMGRWSDYWDGKETLMACGGCGRRTNQPAPTNNPGNPGHTKPSDDAVLLEYIGESPNTMTFKGKSTGTVYRFGANPGHRMKYVHSKDAEHLLQIRHFRVALSSSPVVTEETVRIEAMGPPPRSDVPIPIDIPAVEIVPELVAEPETEIVLSIEDVNALSAEDNGLPSIRELERLLPSMAQIDIGVMLDKEKVGPNRVTAIRMLERAIKNA